MACGSSQKDKHAKHIQPGTRADSCQISTACFSTGQQTRDPWKTGPLNCGSQALHCCRGLFNPILCVHVILHDTSCTLGSLEPLSKALSTDPHTIPTAVRCPLTSNHCTSSSWPRNTLRAALLALPFAPGKSQTRTSAHTIQPNLMTAQTAN
jgi:hypothetical protein